MQQEQLILIVDSESTLSERLLKTSLSLNLRFISTSTNAEALKGIQRYLPHALIVYVPDPIPENHQVLSFARKHFPSIPVLCAVASQTIVDDVQSSKLLNQGVVDLIDYQSSTSLITHKLQNIIKTVSLEKKPSLKENYIRTIKALAIAVDAKDTYTHGHSENVMNIAEAIAQKLSLKTEIIRTIRDAGLLHDIGKIGIPGYILNKPGPLTCEEFNGIMKTHSALGANIIREVPFLQDLYELILCHHEHFDGSGYPNGLQGKQIPLGARILHVADAFEAMISDRPYRKSLGKKEALKRLSEDSGHHFDPVIIAAFMQISNTITLPLKAAFPYPFPTK